MNINDLYHLLADGEFHSGEALGRELGVSRAAIWKLVQSRRGDRPEIECVRGRGYRIPGGVELLSADAIRQHLHAEARRRLGSVEVFEQLDSTNSTALAWAQQGNAHARVCLAESQTAGRGRRGRSWVSPRGRNIYLSLVWGFSGGVAAVEGLSLVVGLAVCAALDRIGVVGHGLKWPNDILWQGRKLGGILLEMTGDPSGYCQVVAGIGINVGMGDAEGVDIAQPWVDLSEVTGVAPGRNMLVGAVLSELVEHISEFEGCGFARFIPEWERRDACRDEVVVVSGADESRSVGRVLGVASDGALRLELLEGGVRHFHAGEVSLRVAQ